MKKTITGRSVTDSISEAAAREMKGMSELRQAQDRADSPLIYPSLQAPSQPPTPSAWLQILCIFMNTGRTYTFRNVKLMMDNETVIVFSYAAMSDGLSKIATFYKDHVAGVSKTQCRC